MCDGITVPVAQVVLRGGRVRITARRPGPVRAAEGPVAIFGEDGQGICQGGTLSWPEVRDGDQLETVVHLSMDLIYD